MRVCLQDAMGRVCRQFDGVKDQSVVLERRQLPAGIYFITVESSAGRRTGKLIWR